MSSDAKPAAAASKDKKEKKKGASRFVDENTEKWVNTTPEGKLKDFSKPMADAYQPEQVEAAWDKWWEEQGLYRPDDSSSGDPFVIVIPPPNVTGTLHLGHALTCSVEDAIIRWNRMSGKNTLWVPGTDHAGIATQVVVEKKLMREQQKSRHELGREPFIQEVWKWKQASGNRICSQLRRLGTSVDWSREVFTMDPQRSAAVEEAFLRLYEKKLIVRANRLVNWSCALRSAISSIEVDHLELEKPTKLKVPGHSKDAEFGVIHSFAYPLSDGSGELVVATTRIETMLGDVAVAVHPDDQRYTAFHGKTLRHPFVADRQVLVIADGDLVDMKFGTGAVKVTPAHDPNDYQCGKRNKLPFINIFTDDGLINENGGQFSGQKRFEVRETIIEELTRLGLYRGKAPNKMALGICSRSKDIVEPVIRPQWYVSCEGMAAKACQAVRSNELEILPSFHQDTWFRWLESIQDWCISRQLWWGHRIPAYHVRFSDESENVDDEQHWFTGRSEADARAKAQAQHPSRTIAHIAQDPDVLDTWFSSGLFPFSVMGWPNQTQDMSKYFPGQLLETGHDILFFWVARMVMMSLELTGQLPFKKIYLHAMVRDKWGRKMSKSLGNVVDPIDVMDGITLDDLCARLLNGNLDPSEVAKATEGQKKDFPEGIAQCGADALRFGLLAYTTQGRDINLDIQRVVAYRQFCNKLWQATRFALLNFDDQFVKPSTVAALQATVAQAPKSLADSWILNRLYVAVQKMDEAFKSYEFAGATTAIYNFWLYDLCDVYLELIKPVVRLPESPSAADIAARNSALAILYTCLEVGLKLMHPLMPFITEELYHRLPGANHQGEGGRHQCGSLMVQKYPLPVDYACFQHSSVDASMDVCKSLAHSARSTRQALNLTKQRVTMYITCETQDLFNIVNDNTRDIATMSMAAQVHALQSGAAPPAGCMSSVVSPQLSIHVPLQGLVDVGCEIVKMERKAYALQQSIDELKAKMSVQGYELSKDEVKERNKQKLSDSQDELSKLNASIDNFKSVLTPEQFNKYVQDKLSSLNADKEKLEKSIEKLKAALPADKDKQPKKSLQKIAETEAELADVLKQISQIKV